MAELQFTASAALSVDQIETLKKVMNGVVDLHLHLAPDVMTRINDDMEFLDAASKVGYKGVILKDHYSMTTERSYFMRKLYKGIGTYGSLALNNSVGGLNADAVEVALQRDAREIWMPTFDSAYQIEQFKRLSNPPPPPKKTKEVKRTGLRKSGLSILSGDGQIRPELSDILGMISDADVILGSGHLSSEETYALVGAARKVGVRKILITHPETPPSVFDAGSQKKFVEMGAMMEHSIPLVSDPTTVRGIAANIRSVGADKCILSSDAGAIIKGHPVVAFRNFIEGLAKEGIKESDVWLMTRTNPSKLLGI
jgi:hypothetical protein